MLLLLATEKSRQAIYDMVGLLCLLALTTPACAM